MTTDDSPTDDSSEQPEHRGFTAWAIGFNPDSRGQNILMGLFYVCFWPVGIPLLLIGVPWNWSQTGRRARRAYIGFFLVLGTIVAVGLVADVSTVDGENLAKAETSEEKVRCWIDNHENKLDSARQQLRDGQTALSNGKGSKSLMHLEKSQKKYGSLESSAHAISLQDAELERVFDEYFSYTYQGVSATYSGVYELQVNDDPAAAERKAEEQGRYFNLASERRATLKAELGVSESTPISEIEGSC